MLNARHLVPIKRNHQQKVTTIGNRVAMIPSASDMERLLGDNQMFSTPTKVWTILLDSSSLVHRFIFDLLKDMCNILHVWFLLGTHRK